MDVDQAIPERLEELHRHRGVVDEGARAPVGADHAAHDTFLPGIDALGVEQGDEIGARGQVEHRRDGWAFCAGARTAPESCAVAEREADRVDENRLACAGFAGDDGEPLGEVDFDAVDQCVIADVQAFEHSGRWVFSAKVG